LSHHKVERHLALERAESGHEQRKDVEVEGLGESFQHQLPRYLFALQLGSMYFMGVMFMLASPE
jgi:hypothetical protein